MSLTRALIWAIVVFLPVRAIAATDPDCPPGPFETDPDAIALSFLFEPPDSDIVKVAEGDFNKTPEISRIRSGVQWHYVGGFINDGLESWQGYDAVRHLFVSIIAESDRYATRMVDVLPGSPVPLPKGDAVRRSGWTNFVATFARATPDQARRFGCKANALVSRYSEPPTLPPLIAGDPERIPGGMFQVTVLARIRRDSCSNRAMPTDTLVQSFSLESDGRYLRVMCDAESDKLRGELGSLVDRALSDAHPPTSRNAPSAVASQGGLKPFVDPYEGRKFNFVH